MNKNAWFLIALGVLSGCASTPKTCPSVAEEPVSLCRAEVACQPSRTQRFAAGFSDAKHNTVAKLMFQTEMCKTNHIEAQKSNAALKLMGSN